jgi:hypothetical protein
MPEYHLYTLDQNGHITGREDLTLPGDQQAIAEAKQAVDGQAVELWSGSNLIARIDPKGLPSNASG